MPIQKLSSQNNGWTKKEVKIFIRNSVISLILHWLDWNQQLGSKDIYRVSHCKVYKVILLCWGYRFWFFLIYLVISNLLWPFSTHLLFFPSHPFINESVCKIIFPHGKIHHMWGKLIFFTLALVYIFFTKTVQTITSLIYKNTD